MRSKEMDCRKFEEFINHRLDLPDFQNHMESCEACRKSYQLDNRIREEAMSLNENLKIPDLWPAIEKDLAKPKPLVFRMITHTKFIIAAAASFLIIATVWFLRSGPGEPQSDRILSANALEKVRAAENNYLKAIDDLELLAYNHLENTDEGLAQLYRNKLSLIDQQIENCKNALDSNPANSHIRRYLLAALQDKQRTLKEIMQLKS
jgi:hypothetical protein